jgi:hypothetical protein
MDAEYDAELDRVLRELSLTVTDTNELATPMPSVIVDAALLDVAPRVARGTEPPPITAEPVDDRSLD